MADRDEDRERRLFDGSYLNRDSMCRSMQGNAEQTGCRPWSCRSNLDPAATGDDTTVGADVRPDPLRQQRQHFVWVDPRVHQQPLCVCAQGIAWPWPPISSGRCEHSGWRSVAEGSTWPVVYECRQRGRPISDDEIALPVPELDPVLNVGWSLGDRDRVANSALAMVLLAVTATAQRALRAQTLLWSSGELLGVQRLVDRFVRDPHRLVAGMLNAQPSCDLFR